LKKSDEQKSFHLGLSSNVVLTSLEKIGNGDFSWASGMLADFVNWAPDQPKASAGDCAGILALVVSVIPCDTVANFICEDTGIKVLRKYMVSKIVIFLLL
jgi:hypothetical protein